MSERERERERENIIQCTYGAYSINEHQCCCKYSNGFSGIALRAISTSSGAKLYGAHC